MSALSSKEIGQYIDALGGGGRTAAAVAGRLLDETVELCLATGLSEAEVLEVVQKALAHEVSKNIQPQNQCDTFRSSASKASMAGECGDIGLILKDFCYITKINLEASEIDKFAKLKERKVIVAPNGTVTTIK